MKKLKIAILSLVALALCGCDLGSTGVPVDRNSLLSILECFLPIATQACMLQSVDTSFPPIEPAANSDAAPYTIWVAEASSATAMSKVTYDPSNPSAATAVGVNVLPGVHATGIASWLGDPTMTQYGLYLWHDNKVEVLTTDASLVATITLPVSGTITDFSISPDGTRGIATVKGDTHLYMLNLQNRRGAGGLDLGGAGAMPRATASPDSTTEWVTDAANGKFYFVDAANGAVIVYSTNGQTTEMGKPRVLHGAGEVWIPDVTHNNVFVTGAGRVTATLNFSGLFDPREIQFSGNGKLGYVLYSPPSGFGPGKMAVVSTSTHMMMSTISVGNQPSGLALSQDGTYQFVANSGDGNVAVIDPSGKVTTVRVGTTPVGVVAIH